MREIAINRETRATPSGTRDMTDEGCNAIDSNKNAERTGEQSGCLALDGILTVSRVCQFVPLEIGSFAMEAVASCCQYLGPGIGVPRKKEPFRFWRHVVLCSLSSWLHCFVVIAGRRRGPCHERHA